MQLNKVWHSYITSGISRSLSLDEQHKLYLINTILLVMLVMFLSFTLYNAANPALHHVMMIDLYSAFVIFLTILSLRRWQKIEWTATFVILLIAVITLSLVYVEKNRHDIIIYLVFLPSIAVFLKGLTKGLIYATLFILFIIAMLLHAMESFESELFTQTSLINLSTTLIGITLLALYYEKSRIKTLKALTKAHDSEHQQRIRLSESKEQFEAIFNYSAFGIVVIDILTHKFIYANPTILAMLGYSQTDLKALSLSDIFPEQDKEQMSQTFRDLYKQMGFAHNISIQRRDGSTFFSDIDASKRYRIGERDYFAVIIRDRTQQYEVERLLHESHERYEALFNQLPEAAWIVDAKTTTFIDINQASLDQYGYSRDEFLNRLHISDIDIFDSHDIVKTRANRIVQNGSEIFETRHRCKEGKEIDVLVSVKLIKLKSRMVLSATCLDITKQKEQSREISRINQRYISLFENLPQPAGVIDPHKQRFINVNKAFTESYGYSLDDISTMHIEDINVGTAPGVIQTKMQEVLKGYEVELETWHKLKNGDTINVIINARKVTLDGNNYIVAIMTDITNLKRLQLELEDITETLQERIADEVQKNREMDHILHDQAKSAQMGEMIRMIAHQWRQPINAISASSIELSLKNSLNELDSNIVDDHCLFIERQTQNMSKTINDFMDFFKPEQRRRRFTMQKLMDELFALIGVQIDNRGIRLHYELYSQVMIFSYFKELIHVMINLISNARDAFEENRCSEKDIWIDCNLLDESIEISITDNAGGIPHKIINNIFNPYFTTKEQGKGTGIGLYMTKRIVEEILKGSIDVQNHENGARFTIAFPQPR